jgi:hypothetical protein
VLSSIVERESCPNSRWRSGQRGSHLTVSLAIARRMVVVESGTCRSGRAAVRTSCTCRFGRGGEMPQPFADGEGVAAGVGGDVVVPSYVRAALVVVEACCAPRSSRLDHATLLMPITQPEGAPSSA